MAFPAGARRRSELYTNELHADALNCALNESSLKCLTYQCIQQSSSVVLCDILGSLYIVLELLAAFNVNVSDHHVDFWHLKSFFIIFFLRVSLCARL